MKLLIAAVILFSSTFTYSQSATSTSPALTPKQQKIAKMIELVGTKRTMETMKVTLKENFVKAYPDQGTAFWEEFFGEMSVDNLVNMIIPIYDKHFTEEDINGLLAFYESPLGKRMIEKLPLIMQESMAVGQKWGAEIGQKVQARIDAEAN